MVSFIGGFGSINTGNVFIELKPKSERRQSADEVIGELRPKLAQVPGINLFLQSVQDVRIGRPRRRAPSTSTRSRTRTSTS